MLTSVRADLAAPPPSDGEGPGVSADAVFAAMRSWYEAAEASTWDGVGAHGPPPFTGEVLVEVAEFAARQRKDLPVAQAALELYFRDDGQRNQVGGLCRGRVRPVASRTITWELQS